MNKKTILLDYGWITLSALLTAVAVNMLFQFTGLAPGGITGLCDRRYGPDCPADPALFHIFKGSVDPVFPGWLRCHCIGNYQSRCDDCGIQLHLPDDYHQDHQFFTERKIAAPAEVKAAAVQSADSPKMRE